ncbi:MAG: hypothetical protein D6718_08180 [Acidobacteria bacterium]|nr:MAG: hypothetical protein D6718_08180 [Acidobacteriota bacterium]
MGNRLFVGNLPYSATDEQIRALFAPHGTLTDVHLAVDRETGRPRGFGFVSFATEEEARRAAEALNGRTFGGRPLVVNIARERGARPVSGDGHRAPAPRPAPRRPPVAAAVPEPMPEEEPSRRHRAKKKPHKERERGAPRRRHLLEEDDDTRAANWRQWLDELDDEEDV